MFLRHFRSSLIYILFAAAVLAVVLGHHGDAAVILTVALVNAVIGTVQEGRAERSMAALRQLSALRVRVLRDGQEALVEARELVPGDVVLLGAGTAMAADTRLLEAAQLQMAEAALTGESVLVPKAGLREDELLREVPRLAELPFDSDAKLMATCHRRAAAGICQGHAADPGRPDRRRRNRPDSGLCDAARAIGRADQVVHGSRRALGMPSITASAACSSPTSSWRWMRRRTSTHFLIAASIWD